MERQIRIITILLLSTFFSIISLFSQNVFHTTFNGRHSVPDVIKTQDKGFLFSLEGPFVGPYSSEMALGFDMTLLKLDSNFNEEWQITLGVENFRDELVSIVEGEDCFWGLGYVENQKKMFLIKLDKQGNKIWVKEINKDTDTSLPSDLKIIDGKLWVFYVEKVRTWYRVPAVIILDKEGNLEASNHADLNIFSRMGEAVEYEGSVYWKGLSVKDGLTNILLVKLNLEGKIEWIRRYNHPDNVSSIYSTNGSIRVENGFVYLFEQLKDIPDFEEERSVLVMKLTLEGEIIQIKGFKSSSYLTNFANHSVLQHKDEFYVGFHVPIGGGTRQGLFKMNQDLEIEWQWYYDRLGISAGGVEGTFAMEDGILEVCGVNSYASGSTGFSLIKIGFDGRSSCSLFAIKLLEKYYTDEYVIEDISFVPQSGVSISDFDLAEFADTEFTSLTLCENTIYALHRVTEAPYCIDQVFEVEVFGNQGDISWNIDQEDIVSYQDGTLKFILREEEFILEGTDLVSGELSKLKIETKCTDYYEPDLTVYNTISPNNDGLNDYLTIRNINYYPDNLTVIVDQYGNVVLEKENYQNNWSPEGVPDGMYRYLIFKSSHDKEPEKGIVVIRK